MSEKNRCLVFYHSADLDGHCSGAIVKYKYSDALMYPIDHGEPFPWSDITKEDTVYMTDFSLPIDDMVRLNALCKEFIWLDHHKSSMDDYANSDDYTIIHGRRIIGTAGCEITWDWLFPNEEMPAGVRLLGRFDVWDHSGSSTLPYQYGMKTLNTNPTEIHSDVVWEMIFNDDEELFKGVMSKGHAIIKYIRNLDKQKCNNCFETEIQGMKAIALNNSSPGNSLTFASVWDNTKYDLMIHFGRGNNGMWNISFYTDKEGIDVSVLAKSYKGGGHHQAAGCTLKELPFKI